MTGSGTTVQFSSTPTVPLPSTLLEVGNFGTYNLAALFNTVSRGKLAGVGKSFRSFQPPLPTSSSCGF
jgi:hypothetical protein